ncbi:MAG: restriction endonuclease subunit S [Acidobacteria bacterium]|nr:restriction endonuclease subunit S [Acidobacteriota bacterium]MBI3657875.1 restriction endonuclease subunit S [Acidobacteriota bacterium]
MKTEVHAEMGRRGETEGWLETGDGFASDWEMKPIREVYRFTTKPRRRNVSKNGRVPFLPMDQIPIGCLRVSTYEERPSDKLTSGTYIENGDLLVARITPSFENGKQAIVDWDRPFGFATTEVIPIQEIKGISDKLFLFYLLLHPEIPSELAGKMDGTTGRQRLSKETLGSRIIPIPPLAEQRKIAGVLGLVQRALEQQERLIALTTELRKALLHQLFTQGLRGETQKQTEIGPMPGSWEVVALGSLAKVGNGSTPKRDNEGYWQGGTIPWLNSAKIHERFITEADQFVTDLAVKECHLPRVKPGSLLIAITGQGKTLGNSALISFETCINQHLAYAQFTSPKIVPEFVLWFMQTRYEHLRSISQAGGSTKGALTCGYLKTYPIPVPSLDEQREIVGVFAALDRKEKVHERKHATLTALFRTLLHQLMTAQIRVYNLDLSELPELGKDLVLSGGD